MQQARARRWIERVAIALAIAGCSTSPEGSGMQQNPQMMGGAGGVGGALPVGGMTATAGAAGTTVAGSGGG